MWWWWENNRNVVVEGKQQKCGGGDSVDYPQCVVGGGKTIEMGWGRENNRNGDFKSQVRER